MPHQCTTCGRTFPDGSKEMLSGCPDCGGNKFQFAPSDQSDGAGTDGPATTGESSSTSSSQTANAAGTVERAAETVRGWVSSDATRSADTGPGTERDTGPGTERDTGADATAVSHTDQPSTDTRSSPDTAGDDGELSWPTNTDRTDSIATSDSDAGTDDSVDTIDENHTFEEWPDTARRPEDRSTDTGEASPSADADAGSGVAASSDPRHERGAPSSDRVSADKSDRVSADNEVSVGDEDSAQADARSELASTSDLPSEPAAGRGAGEEHDTSDDRPPGHGRVVSEPSDETPSIDELREELNEQFESIKIVSPGQYELNLMELYNREEYIISLQEDGRYVIDVPDSWREDADET